MKKFIFQMFILAAIGTFTFDAIEDSVSVHKETTTSSSDCHACACGQHFNTEAPAVQSSPVTFQSYLTFEPTLTEYLPANSFFHPPKHLA